MHFANMVYVPMDMVILGRLHPIYRAQGLTEKSNVVENKVNYIPFEPLDEILEPKTLFGEDLHGV